MFCLDSGLNEHDTTRLSKEPHMGWIDVHLFETIRESALGENFIIARREIISISIWGLRSNGG